MRTRHLRARAQASAFLAGVAFVLLLPDVCLGAQCRQFEGQLASHDSDTYTLWWNDSTSDSAVRYRAELELRVPEGKVLRVVDVVTEIRTVTFSAALAEGKAALKVRVSSDCPSDAGEAMREEEAKFFIDSSRVCVAPASISLAEGGSEIRWPPVAGAVKYDVALSDAISGREIAKEQTMGVAFAIPSEHGLLIAVVRPFCHGGFGASGVAIIAR